MRLTTGTYSDDNGQGLPLETSLSKEDPETFFELGLVRYIQ